MGVGGGGVRGVGTVTLPNRALIGVSVIRAGQLKTSVLKECGLI